MLEHLRTYISLYKTSVSAWFKKSSFITIFVVIEVVEVTGSKLKSHVSFQYVHFTHQSVQTIAIYMILFNKYIQLVLQELTARNACKDLTF